MERHQEKDGQEIWILDTVTAEHRKLSRLLREERYTVKIFGGADQIFLALSEGALPSLLLLSLDLLGKGPNSIIVELKQQARHCVFLFITETLLLDHAVRSFQQGGSAYLEAPLRAHEAHLSIIKAIRRAQHTANIGPFMMELPAKEIIGISPAMQEIYRTIAKLSNTDVTVLLTGESGTGKELVARAIHRHSPRADLPFVGINMAAIPSQLVESELFGHERGAFTGASSGHQGYFEQAEGGTLFLDEIGDMSIELQTRLLRVISEREFYPVGGVSPLTTHVRIIAATHHDLSSSIRKGTFREDLYHRLNAFRIDLPPLRDRGPDIPLLMNRFLGAFSKGHDLKPKSVSPEAMQCLCRFSWPGNVRQLENVCRWLAVMVDEEEVTLETLPHEVRHLANPAGEESPPLWQDALRQWTLEALRSGSSNLAQDIFRPVEQIMIDAALEVSRGRRNKAAKLLGLGRNTLARKIAPERKKNPEETEQFEG